MGEALPAFGLAFTALVVEAIVGYPDWLHRRVPHPVVWIGAMIAARERTLNRQRYRQASRKILGIATTIFVAGISGAAGWGLQRICGNGTIGFVVLVLLATLGLAQKSLYQHVAHVAAALSAGDLDAARLAVARIVGRDVDTLDRNQVAGAGLESLSESFSDGVVAPVFWLIVAGLPGIFAYKAVNTADSLIGHREERWRAFGWAAARLDDLMNLIPARIAGGLIVLAGLGGGGIMLRDAPKHDSPNAGWPEAAMAGALGVQLGGPASYDGVETARPTFGDGHVPQPADLTRGLKIYVRACGLLWLVVAIAALRWGR